jgi:hypothetical protein
MLDVVLLLVYNALGGDKGWLKSVLEWMMPYASRPT